MMKAEIGVMFPELRNSGSHWKLKEGMEDPPPRNFRGGIALLTPRFYSLASSYYERISYCCFKAPSLQ